MQNSERDKDVKLVQATNHPEAQLPPKVESFIVRGTGSASDPITIIEDVTGQETLYPSKKRIRAQEEKEAQLGFSSKVAEILKCAICRGLLYKPVIFCAGCLSLTIDHWSRSARPPGTLPPCPTCRSAMSTTIQDRTTAAVVDCLLDCFPSLIQPAHHRQLLDSCDHFSCPRQIFQNGASI
ncbi:hypothetical protein QR680_002131 [Steinernema hermaphroditum]|uniref:Uncharacterized protein n=1 Tax=Steinernema hermaphroditum TaxID=289476 RepID=A0AA39H1G6_9BILA|nr:hypothetical protein QR680_002131 [Steinernema hermaphroditum]